MIPRFVRPIASLSRSYFIPSKPALCTVQHRLIANQNKPVQEELMSDKEEREITQSTISQVNNLVKTGNEGRLFAVIDVLGKQMKVTTEDIIILEGHFPPKNGDEIKFEKVMVVGGLQFSLIGRPFLPRDLVDVKGVVIEKDLSETKTIFFKRRRKQYMRTNFYRSELTMLRITDVSVPGTVGEHQDVIQFEKY